MYQRKTKLEEELCSTVPLCLSQVHQSSGDDASAASQTESDGQRVSGGAALPEAEQGESTADQRDSCLQRGPADGL